jgi:hypothetical protein
MNFLADYEFQSIDHIVMPHPNGCLNIRLL